MKLGFRIHLVVFVGINLLLIIINLSTSSDYLWVKWPIIGWGIGLFFHGMNVYVFPNSTTITDEMIKKEMERTDRL